MSQIEYSPQAYRDLERFRAFLVTTAPEKVGEAINTILSKIDLLETIPLAGVAVENSIMPNLRKLVIPYGQNGYVALYKYNDKTEKIVIETIRHMRELEPEFLRTK